MGKPYTLNPKPLKGLGFKGLGRPTLHAILHGTSGRPTGAIVLGTSSPREEHV